MNMSQNCLNANDGFPDKSCFLEQDTDEKEEFDPGPLGNPLPPPDVDLDKLRGDRIGDTVYSGKWCIQTVMKLMQSNVVLKAEVDNSDEEKPELVDMEEELQNEVGVLWDMTSNVEVCQYLHSIGAIESICYVITNSRCPRASEMCVGMLANMITHKDLWDILKEDANLFDLLVELLTNTDQPVLLEVTRFFNTAMCHQDNGFCYSRLCDSGQQVTSELVRILSGSTHADLLKQAAELTFNLMYSDEDETHFCAFFAEDPDFVVAAVEASKELGYEHELPGQNYLMEVFHCFTTYQAGMLVLENNMEQISETCGAYLKSLCTSLNLSSSCTIITTIIATLNHIFCRNIVVRIELMASPSFAHCVLKTLVAVYRKLGCYKAIAYPKGEATTHSVNTSKTAASSWQCREDSGSSVKPKDAASWSERADAASAAQTSVFRTPDPSPKQIHRAKELEVSWSERRMSSPLADDEFAEETWKRPREKKKLKKKIVVTKVNGKEENKADKRENEVTYSSEEKGGHGQGDEETTTGSVDNSSTASVRVKRIEPHDRFDQSESRNSSGFSPQQNFEEMDTEKRDEMDSSTATRSQGGGMSNKEEGEQKVGPLAGKVNKEQEALAKASDCSDWSNDQCKKSGLKNVPKFESSSEEDNSGGGSDDDDVMSHNSDKGFNGEKYHKLLVAIKEFLSDYLNNLRETLLTDTGSPYISDLMTYLNSQCSSTEIRAVVKCVGSDTDLSKPLGRLLQLSDHFKAWHLKSVILKALTPGS
ncbi:unnamed protein product [Lymnaea stagnalis]|uniref:Uncharacterized protein n=1 Tax=Lymnaea stagnalis TaxID=6523 RepID=A0AAV2I4U9_LYMST